MPDSLKILIVFCGQPGSGKTTCARRLVQVAEVHGYSVTHVHFDEVYAENSGCFDPVAWKRSRSLCFTKAELALTTSDIVIMDDTMHYQSMRLQCWKMARLHRLCYCQVYMDCEYNVCVGRNQERGENARVPDSIMERMRDIFESPGTQKPWDRLTVRFNIEFDNVDALWEVIRSKYWSTPAPALEAESQLDTMIRQVTAETCTHQVDILTRKALSESLNNVSRKNIAHLARSLNRDRRDVLKKYRHFLARQVFQDNSDQDSIQIWTNHFKLHCQSIIESTE